MIKARQIFRFVIKPTNGKTGFNSLRFIIMVDTDVYSIHFLDEFRDLEVEIQRRMSVLT